MNEKIKILAIETSCDETAAAVIGEKDGKPVILSNIISSQIDLHAKTGGVVPEVASRAHMEAIMPVIAEALAVAKQNVIPAKAGIQESINLDSSSQATGWNDNFVDYQKAIALLNDITHIAVTSGPGLIGSLLVGFNAAKTLAYTKELSIIPINHIEGHIYSAFVDQKGVGTQIKFPVLALTVSGGHTSLILMENHGQYKVLGETLDDAVGEAYDKVAKMLGLGYPGGPIISKFASNFRRTGGPSNLVFPRPIINDNTLNFSFSGLKTAVLQCVLNLKRKQYSSCHPELDSGSRVLDSGSRDTVRNDISGLELSQTIKEEIAFAFEEAVAAVLVAKTIKATKEYLPVSVIFAGGVSANAYLRQKLEQAVKELNKDIVFLSPKSNLCGDNAAMIGIAAYYHLKRKDVKTWDQIKVDSNLELK